MSIEAVSINGKLFSPAEAEVSAVDRGLMFAHGAFETFRVSEDNIFLHDEHFARLDKSLKALDISWTYDKDKHLGWIKGLSSSIPAGKDGRIRFCVTSGIPDGQPNVIIYLSLIDKFKPIEKKARILKSITRHQPEYFSATGFRIKSLEYSYLYLAKKELQDESSEGILLNPAGYVAEALTANIFWSKAGKIYTPPLNLGILAGTVRGWLMDNFGIEEKLAQQEELFEADEIFLTTGASYLIGISQINGMQKPGISGPSYKKIYQLLIDRLPEESSQV
ncbi:MAG TPA: aminotransferase class IV [Candidatus Saccharimonadales bacterium]|nr:aminotransferase class IV [Candidatus Saccharimonadales bacterium]